MVGEIPLRDYVDALFAERAEQFATYVAEHEKFTAAAIAALRDAAAKADAGTEKRFDRVDELRQGQDALVGALMPRTEAEARISAAAERSDQQVGTVAERVEAIRALLEQASFVTREFFDRYSKEETEKHARILDQISVIYTDISNMKGRNAAWAAAGGIFLTILTITINVLMRVL